MIKYPKTMPPPIEIPDFYKTIKDFRKQLPPIETHPDKWKEIYLHHCRVQAVFEALLQNQCVVPSPSEIAIAETKIAVTYHDYGKMRVAHNIHEQTKDPILAAYFDLMYRFHPAATLAVLGEEFINQHPLAAQLIFFHHPDQPIAKPFLGIDPTPSQTPEFSWGLPVLIAVDGMTSGWEIRPAYGRKNRDTPEFTIGFLTEKFAKYNLNGVVDIPKSVAIGYQTLNLLGF